MEQRDLRFNKKRSPAAIVSDSFFFLRLHSRPLSRLILIYVLPFILMYSVASVFLQMKIETTIDLNDQEQILQNIVPVYGNLFLLSLFSLFVQALFMGTFYTYVEVLIKNDSDDLNISNISHLLFPNTLLALGISLVVALIVFAGIILCVIPGIYFANSLSLSLFIVIIERKGIGNAITRSFQLVSIRWWDTFLINLTGLFFIVVIALAFSIPSMIQGISSSVINFRQGSETTYPDWYWVLSGISTVVSNLFYIVIYTFYVFHYFNLLEYTRPVEPPGLNQQEG